MRKLETITFLSFDSDAVTKQIGNDSIQNTIHTKSNGYCQDNAYYTLVWGNNAKEVEGNLRGIPAQQSSSLSFLGPPTLPCLSDFVKVLLKLYRKNKNISSLFVQLDSSLYCITQPFWSYRITDH